MFFVFTSTDIFDSFRALSPGYRAVLAQAGGLVFYLFSVPVINRSRKPAGRVADIFLVVFFVQSGRYNFYSQFFDFFRVNNNRERV